MLLSPFFSLSASTQYVFDRHLNCLRESFGNTLFIPVWAQLALYRPIYYSVQITLICWQILPLCAVLLLASAGYQRLSVFVLSCCVLSYARWRYVVVFWCVFFFLFIFFKGCQPSKSRSQMPKCITLSSKHANLFSKLYSCGTLSMTRSKQTLISVYSGVIQHNMAVECVSACRGFHEIAVNMALRCLNRKKP